MAVTYFEMGMYFKAVDFIRAARMNYKNTGFIDPKNTATEIDTCLFEEIDILLMHATMLRSKGEIDKAAKVYR